MSKYFTSVIGRLRVVAFLEGCSYLGILVIGMPLKYFYESGETNMILGQAHGLLFLLFIVLTALAAMHYKWKLGRTFWVLLSSIIPFGTFIVDHKILKKIHQNEQASPSV